MAEGGIDQNRESTRGRTVSLSALRHPLFLAPTSNNIAGHTGTAVFEPVMSMHRLHIRKERPGKKLQNLGISRVK